MSDSTKETIFICAAISIMVVSAALVLIEIFASTKTEVITLDSGKQCIATVKFNNVTNLDCEG